MIIRKKSIFDHRKSKPGTFGHQTLKTVNFWPSDGFTDVAATWWQGPHDNAITFLSPLYLFLLSFLSSFSSDYRRPFPAPPAAPTHPGNGGARARTAGGTSLRHSSSSLTRRRCPRQSSSSPLLLVVISSSEAPCTHPSHSQLAAKEQGSAAKPRRRAELDLCGLLPPAGRWRRPSTEVHLPPVDWQQQQQLRALRPPRGELPSGLLTSQSPSTMGERRNPHGRRGAHPGVPRRWWHW